MKNERGCARPVELKRLAVASAVAVSLGIVLSAQAQTFYEWSGAVTPTPTPSGAILSLGVPLVVGDGGVLDGVGSFSALAGAQLTATQLAIGSDGNGNGTATLSGSGTLGTLNASVGTRLDVGGWGTGKLEVLAGAKLDAASAPCPDNTCTSFVGNAAGSNATMNVFGAGSEVSTRGFVVGQSSVFTNPPSSFVFGTQGGTTTATVNVSTGGTLRNQGGTVGSNNASPDGNTLVRANGTVNVSGPGSQWVVTPIDGGTGPAFLTIGVNAGGTGTVNVSNGGSLRIDGTGGVGPNDGINIGGNGGTGIVEVTGLNSRIDLIGVNPVLNVGRANSASGAVGNGSFSAMAGANVTALYVRVGRSGAIGSMTIDGATVTQSGVGVPNNNPDGSPANDGSAANAHIGRDGGTGTVNVRNGGQWLINDGGLASTVAGPALHIGRGAGSTGTLNISGAGSVVEIKASSVTPGAGENRNPFLAVGLDNGANGTQGFLNIDMGGKLLITGNATSTPTNPRGTSLFVGGFTGGVGRGTVTVDGLGSEILMSGFDASLNVGRLDGSTGVLNVQNKALVTTTSMGIGVGSTGAVLGPNKSRGTVNIDDAKILLTGARTDGSNVGAGITVGRGVNGIGALNLSNGGQLQINSTAANGGMSIGGDGFLGGGQGTVTMSGGSSIVSTGQTSGINVGWSGIGLIDMSGGSFINLAAGGMDLAGVPNAGQSLGNGTMSLASGSRATANAFNIGGNSDTVGAVGGTALVTVSGLGSELKADGANGFIGVGRNGTGTLNVTDSGKVSAIVLSVGRSGGTGTLNATNATIQLAGQQTTGALAGPALIIGQGGGTGTMNMLDSTMSIQNALTSGSNGASINVGGTVLLPGGTGTLNMTNSQASVGTATAAATAATVHIGRNGTGNATLDNSTITVSDGTADKGSVFIGREAGSTGTLTLNNASAVNAGFVGIGVSAAGTGNAPAGPGGTGSLLVNSGVVNAGRVEVGALGSVSVGASGTLNVSSLGSAGVASPLSSSVYVAQQAGSTGTLVVGSATTPGAVLNADFVGIGVNAKAVNGVQSNGGAGTLVLNNSTINTKHFELGAGSLLTGNEGVIEAGTDGPVIIGGTIAPGNSPGRIRIRCDVTMLLGSQLILEIDNTGATLEIDRLIIGEDSTFDLTDLQIVFAFVGNTDPTKVNLDLGEFLRAETSEGEKSLAALFGKNDNPATWGAAVNSNLFAFQSSAYDVTGWTFDTTTGAITGVEASRIPEPATYALVLLAMLAMAAQRRRAAARRV